MTTVAVSPAAPKDKVRARPAPPKSILTAVDLAPGGRTDDVLHAGAILAQRADANFHVLHAFEFGHSAYLDELLIWPTFENRFQSAQQTLHDRVAAALPHGVSVASAVVVIDVAHRALAARAHDVHADLLVLGPHRGRSLHARILGSTANHAIRASGLPCWIVCGETRLPLERIIVATDFSETARRALDLVLAWIPLIGIDAHAKRAATEVVLTHHVWRGVDREAPTFESTFVRPQLAQEEARAAEAARATGIALRTVLLHGDDPGRDLRRYAARQNAGLVVVGTAGHGVLHRLMLGSFAASVVAQSRVPVLTVPPLEFAGDRGDQRMWRASRTARTPQRSP